MGREQILNRLKEIQDGNSSASDLLAVILKSHGNNRKNSLSNLLICI